MKKHLEILTFLSMMVAFTLLSSGVLSLSIAADKLVLATGAMPDSKDFRFLELLYEELSRKAGVKIIMESYPVKRCGYLANKGSVDGVVEQTYDFHKVFSNLIRVEPNLRNLRMIALSADPDIRLHGWDSLKDTDYRVDYVLGVTRAHKGLSRYVSLENLTAVVTPEQGIKKLAADRTEVFVDLEVVIDRVLKSAEMKPYQIYRAGVMEEERSHIFLHKKHKAVMPRISAALRQMKDQGLVEKYEAMAFEE